ncbi:MAG TPA: carboxypeptidase-like regulatory domain-containing protein [Methanomassiliicoccales archaeon]|nr:carboxypeptidase-like regulatory domain-containing protein [Methanomassiliicoccales archaeon]
MGHKTSIFPSKKFRNDRRAGIEGLPLQLMILVLIAGVGSAVMMGWMTGLKAPLSIASVYAEPGEIILNDGDGDAIYRNSSVSITINVVDQNGNGVEGAIIVLGGCNIATSTGGTVHGLTDASGSLAFTNLKASHIGGPIGFISVTVSKSGYGTDSSQNIPVICG